jgi:type 1 glutamine amidotransferase
VKPARNLLLTGGIVHPFESSAPALARLLSRYEIESTVTEDFESGLADLARGEFDLLTMYALRWSMKEEKYAPHRRRWSLTLSTHARDAILAHVQGGGGLLGLHTATICFDDWPEWRSILGGAWVWGRSSHPPFGPAEVRITRPDHPLVRNLPDFLLKDEVYGDLSLEPDVTPLMKAMAVDAAAGWQPVLWERRVGRGRVVYGALGHDAEAIEHPVHSRIVARSALWALGASDAEIASV